MGLSDVNDCHETQKIANRMHIIFKTVHYNLDDETRNGSKTATRTRISTEEKVAEGIQKRTALRYEYNKWILLDIQMRV